MLGGLMQFLSVWICFALFCTFPSPRELRACGPVVSGAAGTSGVFMYCFGTLRELPGCIFLPGALDKRGIKRARVPASPPRFGFRLCRACQPAPRSWGLRRIISIYWHIWCRIDSGPQHCDSGSSKFCGTHRCGCRGCLSLFPNEFSDELDGCVFVMMHDALPLKATSY